MNEFWGKKNNLVVENKMTTRESLHRMKAEIRRLERLRGGQKILPLRRLFNARLHGGDDDDTEWKYVDYDACPGNDDPIDTIDAYGNDFD